MEEVVFKALAKDQLQRFASIEAFASALEQAMTPTVHLSRLETVPVWGQPPVPSNYPPFTGRELSSSMLSGPHGKTALTSTDLTIGRAPDTVYVINDRIVSGHHAAIRPQGQAYVLIDLGSTNGTFVNGHRLTPQQPYLLSLNDLIRIGNTQYIYEQNNSPQLHTPPIAHMPPVASQVNVVPTIVDIPAVYQPRTSGSVQTPRFSTSTQRGSRPVL